jgi:Zn finger protein HypA/HybF involved in hydrogenase expression
MAKAKCPECGKMGECYYLGNTSITHNILDDYRFICPHCGLDKMETVDGGEVGGEERLTNCPFCRNDNLHHPGGGLTMPQAEKLALETRMKKAGLCPTCGQRLPAKTAPAESGKPKITKRKDDELCPRCGEHKLSCEYLGDLGGADHHRHVWEHNCQCGFHDQLTRLADIKQRPERGAPPEYGAGKEGGCPGHCD